jgi:hypothetical protein
MVLRGREFKTYLSREVMQGHLLRILAISLAREFCYGLPCSHTIQLSEHFYLHALPFPILIPSPTPGQEELGCF